MKIKDPKKTPCNGNIPNAIPRFNILANICKYFSLSYSNNPSTSCSNTSINSPTITQYTRFFTSSIPLKWISNPKTPTSHYYRKKYVPNYITTQYHLTERFTSKNINLVQNKIKILWNFKRFVKEKI